MTAKEFLQRPLIPIRCVHVKHNGKRCMRWLGDFVAGVHTVQNFKCPEDGIEWLAEKDKTDAVVFIRVPNNTRKNYRKDTGFRIEISPKSLTSNSPDLMPGE